jgi:Translocation protein Sec62
VRAAQQALTGSAYHKACQRSKILPRVTKETAMDMILSLQLSDLIVRVESLDNPTKQNPPPESWYTGSLLMKDEKRRNWIYLGDDDCFTFPTPVKPSYVPYLVSLAYFWGILGLYFLRDLVQDIPGRVYFQYKSNYYNWRINLTGPSVMEVILWLVAAPFIIVIARTLLFTLTHLFCPQGLWLFPRLLEDNTFLGVFVPLFEWDTAPRESLGLRWRRFNNMMLKEIGVVKRRKGKKTKRLIRVRGNQ